jgi:hypothetical protein
MASNGTQTHGGGKLSFKPTHSEGGGVRPTLPADHWVDCLIPRGGLKVTATKNNEPMLNIRIKLGTPDNDENATFKGAEETLRIVFYDDKDGEKVRAANMSRLRLRSLCESIEVDYDEVYPASIETEDDLADLISALENKKIPEMWTTHREGKMPSGETTVNIDLHFKEPGQGLATAKADGDDEDEAPAKKPAKKTGRR